MAELIYNNSISAIEDPFIKIDNNINKKIKIIQKELKMLQKIENKRNWINRQKYKQRRK